MDCRFSFSLRGIGHEAKTTGATGITIAHDDGLQEHDFSFKKKDETRDKSAHPIFDRTERRPADRDGTTSHNTEMKYDARIRNQDTQSGDRGMGSARQTSRSVSSVVAQLKLLQNLSQSKVAPKSEGVGSLVPQDY